MLIHKAFKFVSTHSRPKAAGLKDGVPLLRLDVSTHSRPKAAGCFVDTACHVFQAFQLTAARRRLGLRISQR